MVFPEYSSIESFVEFCLDDDVTEFSHEDLVELNRYLHIPIHKLREMLETYGMSLKERQVPRQVRGFRTSSHDRWFGPGSCKTHGGSAFGQMMVSKYGSKDTPFG
jgi:hypothetical protein